MKYYWADSVLNCIIDKLIVFSIFSIFDSFVDTPKLNGYNKLDNKPDLSSILYGRNASTLQIFATLHLRVPHRYNHSDCLHVASCHIENRVATYSS